MIRKIEMTGPFDDEQIIMLLQMVRAFDHEAPADAFFNVRIADEDGNLANGERLIRAAFPERDDRVTTVTKRPL